MSDVLVEEPDGDGLEGFGDGADLGEDVDAVGVFVDHATDAADLAFDAVEALGVVVLGDGVAAGGGFGHRAWNLRRRRLLVTTKMLDRKSTRLNSRSLMRISYAVFCLQKKKHK